MRPLPKKISPCPIIEAVVEVRFSSLLPSEAIFGVAYSRIGADFEKAEKLPILQVPEAIRSQDENWKYQAYYSLLRGNLNLKIGPRVLTFSNVDTYVGWSEFLPFIMDTMRKLKDSDIIKVPERIGIRYINLFRYQILDQVNLDLRLNGRAITKESTNIRTELVQDDFLVILQVANNTGIKTNNFEGQGSLLDIDCIHGFSAGTADFFEQFEGVIERGHRIEKEVFFSLLSRDHLDRLHPEL